MDKQLKIKLNELRADIITMRTSMELFFEFIVSRFEESQTQNKPETSNTINKQRDYIA